MSVARAQLSTSRHTSTTTVLVTCYTITIPYRTVPYRTVPYRTVPYRTVPYHTIPPGPWGAPRNSQQSRSWGTIVQNTFSTAWCTQYGWQGPGTRASHTKHYALHECNNSLPRSSQALVTGFLQMHVCQCMDSLTNAENFTRASPSKNFTSFIWHWLGEWQIQQEERWQAAG
jgi:hypothetical protein